MSEPVPQYDAGQRKPWRCERCGAEIATVDDKGEAWYEGKVILGPRVVMVQCPECGKLNPWCIEGGA